MKKDELLSLLQVFKDARNKLVSDFLEEDSNIFIPIYRYEDDSNMTQNSIEYYFLQCFNFHFKLFSERYDTSSPQYLAFIKAMSSLLDCYIAKDKDDIANDSGFIFRLMQDKQEHLTKIFELNDKSESNYRKLLHYSSKDKALFERKFKTLQGER
ncbi:MAG: DUF2600 family protein [Thermodesulfobacteriota bacterium]|nr:DUF2600 family protein [Thermodesulfobacteriota bacterium]